MILIYWYYFVARHFWFSTKLNIRSTVNFNVRITCEMEFHDTYKISYQEIRYITNLYMLSLLIILTKRDMQKHFFCEIWEILHKFQEWEVPAYEYVVSSRYAYENRIREAFVYDPSYFILFENIVFQYVKITHSDFTLIFQYLSVLFYRFVLRLSAEI